MGAYRGSIRGSSVCWDTRPKALTSHGCFIQMTWDERRISTLPEGRAIYGDEWGVPIRLVVKGGYVN